MLLVMLVVDSAERACIVGEALRRNGCTVVAEIGVDEPLLQRACSAMPELVVIDVASPSEPLLTALHALDRVAPRPVLMFARDDSRTAIHDALRAGVHAYVFEGWSEERLRGAIGIAQERFAQIRALRQELEAATGKLAERKLVERAKGILMKSRNMSEEDAYIALRRMAMDKKLRLSQVAEHVIAVSDLLV